jgi:carboxypeptidase C (cathepsin A)
MTELARLSKLSSRGLVVALLLIAGAPALAQRASPHAAPAPGPASSSDPAPGGTSDTQQPRAPRSQNASQRLPDEVATAHRLDVGGRTLEFTATAGAIPLSNTDGALQAEVAYVAYVASGAQAAERPVTFLINGGPGAASAYLDIGAIGPWRLPLDRIAPSVQPALVPNAETWLDFTDLVFIDPPGTGYSRIVASGDAARRQFWSIDGDADALAVVIRKWLEKAGRQTSAKFIVGESYGGFRAPKIAKVLQGDQGVGIRGLVMVSPVLDFAGFGQRRYALMSWVAHLPSMAAAALEIRGRFDREALRDVEQYATGDYLRDLIKGERDEAAVERISARVAAVTGLDPAVVRRLAGRVDSGTFQRELYRDRGLVGSAYDPTVTAFDPNPRAANTRFSDPMLDGLTAPLTSAMTDLYQRVLKWRVDLPYRLLDRDVSSHWDWGRSRTPPEAVDDLRSVLAADPQMRVLVAHGATDLVTPYFGNQLLLDQLPVFGVADRVKLAVYAGGHMFYNRDASRRALRQDAQAMYRAALAPAPPALRD